MADNFDEKRPPSLEEFSKRLEATRSSETSEKRGQSSEGAQMGQGLKVASELLAAFLVGGGMGWGLDFLFSTPPWLMLLGLGFGFAAGIRNVIRSMDEMDRGQSGENSTDIEDEKD